MRFSDPRAARLVARQPRFAPWAIAVVLTAFACGPGVAAPPSSTTARSIDPLARNPTPTAPPRETVTFKSGSLDLQGFIWKPAGGGPFPAVLWNHGGDNAASDPYYEKLWPVHVQAGFLFFVPQRRGQGGSPGVSVNVQFGQAPAADRNRMQVELYSTVALSDELAALAYLKSRADVDASRIAVSGWSAGGQLTLIGAEADPGYRVAVACSSASVSWDGSPELQERLIATVGKIKIPVLLYQAQNDYSLNPQKVLGAEFKRLGKRYEETVFPSHGTTPQEGHAFCVDSPEVWGDRVMTFIRTNMR